MKVLRVRPKHYPEVIDIDCSLESLQKEVEGPIQAVYPWDDEVALICNEEGKLHDDCMEKLNRTLDGPYGIPKKRCLVTKFPQNCIAATMDEIITHILQCSLEKRTIREMLLRFTSIM